MALPDAGRPVDGERPAVAADARARRVHGGRVGAADDERRERVLDRRRPDGDGQRRMLARDLERHRGRDADRRGDRLLDQAREVALDARPHRWRRRLEHEAGRRPLRTERRDPHREVPLPDVHAQAIGDVAPRPAGDRHGAGAIGLTLGGNAFGAWHPSYPLIHSV